MGRVNLPIDAETTKLVLKYIYTGQNVITKDSVTTLYNAAHYLQITSLIEDCKTFLKQGMDEVTCLEVWIVSKKFDDREVAEISRSVVLQGFKMLCTMDHMGIVPIEDLKDLFQDPYLNCTGRSKCEAAWVWLAAQEEPDDTMVENLLNALLVAVNVESSDVVEVWSEHIDGCSNDKLDKLQEMWQRVCKKLWITAEASASSISYELDECLALLGHTKAGNAQLIAFDFKKKQWFDLMPSVRDLGHRFAISSRGSLLYISGGTMSKKSLLQFDGATKLWHDLPAMPVGREQHVMWTIQDRLYVLGGTSQSSEKLWDVHVYDCRGETWASCGQLACPVVAACSARVDNNIILLGGSESADGRAPSDILQYYDIATNTGFLLDVRLPFKTKSHMMSVTNISNSLYIVHKAEVYLLEPFVKKPRAEQNKRLPGLQKVGPRLEKMGSLNTSNPPVKGFAVESFGSKVLVFGGEDASYSTKNSVIQYDTAEKHAVLLPHSMPHPMKDFCITKLLVPKSWDVTNLSST